MKVVTFYKYTEIKNSEKFVEEHLTYCKKLGIKGKILVSNEGINGGISGEDKKVEEYKKKLLSYSEFKGIEFKDTYSDEYAYRKMFVRVRKEIIRFDPKVDGKKASCKLSPKKLKEMLDKKEDVVLLDVRNRYETRIGKFKNAIELGIDVFNEFPKNINKINGLKNKKIVMYCTGGVRCEKASAALLNQGFKDVYQLDGGILNYGKECSDAHWEGKCFVFDRRVSIPLDSTKEVHPISRCDICNEFSDIYVNCKNVECDKLFICCKNCQSRHKGYCPEEIN